MLVRDKENHVYAEVKNLRITYIPAKDRTTSKNWSGLDVIRVQSYRNAISKSLHKGAEIPIESPAAFGQFIAAVCQVYVEGKP